MKLLHALAATIVALAPHFAAATPDARAEAEIQALLAFVERSPCRFVRSEATYDGKEARAHLARKYDYARWMLSTADQFVQHVASASSVTGEEYRVRCGDQEQPARSWLASELARMRSAATKGAPPR
jgi:hypothetical protein